MVSPAVSVILPVYNGEDYLRLAIESVLKQTLQDYELIIIDDGSRDSSPEIARSYGSRVRYVRQDNTGVAGAFNHGLRLASGRYISWLSHDDVFLPEKLERQVAALDRIGSPAVSYTDVQMIDATGTILIEHQLPELDRAEAIRQVLTGGPISQASYSICYDRRCIDEVGPYSEYWRYTQDAEMLFRLARRFPMVRVPQALMQMREHEGRGVRSPQWESEATRFFAQHLNSLEVEELFPHLTSSATKQERSRALQELGDSLAGLSYPVNRAAFSQYRRALQANAADAPRILRKAAWLWRHSLRERLKRKFGRREQG